MFKIKTKTAAKPVYALTPVAAVLFYGVMLVVFAIFLFRSHNVWESLPGQIGSHFSNFAISYLIVAGPGLMNLVIGTPFLAVWLIAGALVFANLLAEFALTFINTKDPLDAVYGIAGVLLGVGMLLFVRRYGLTKVPAKPPKK